MFLYTNLSSDLRISIFKPVDVKHPPVALLPLVQTMETAPTLRYASPVELAFATTPVHIAPLNASEGGDLLTIAAPPRRHFAPSIPGTQQSSGGDLSVLTFDAIDDLLLPSAADISFTLQNTGVAAADSFKIDVIFSRDELLGNSDDVVVDGLVIDSIGAQNTLTRTLEIDYGTSEIGFLAIQLDTQNRVIELDESNNFSKIKAVGTDLSHCLPDESVLTQGGRYSAEVGLTASLALPGNQGVDVVMTEDGAIAAVNTDTGASLYWIDPETGVIGQSVSLTSAVSDIAFDGAGGVAIAAQDKLLRLSAETGEVLSEIELAGISRVAVAGNGIVGAIADKTVHLYSADNTLLFSKFLDYTEVTDLEIRSCGDGNNLVYITSFRNTSFVGIDGSRNPIQIARLEAFDFTGQRQWSLFGDDTETIKQNVADTRLYRVTLGQDGYLYIGGESAGTATIFRWRGQPMTPEEQFGSTSPFLTQIDANSRLYNSGSAHISYYARVHPMTGKLLNSQLSFPRLRSTKSNTMKIGDIATSSSGTLYFGGAAFGTLPNRENLTFNGQSAGGYSGRDPAWMSIAPNFQARNFWTSVSGQDGTRGIVQGVDAGYGYSAALSNLDAGIAPAVTDPTIDSLVFLSFTTE